MSDLDIWRSNQIERIKRDMDRIFDRVWGEFGFSIAPRPAREFPVLDIIEMEDRLIIKADLSGIDPDDLEISVSDDSVFFKGEMRRDMVDKTQDFHRSEHAYSAFSRTVRLPCRVLVDDVKAEYSRGMLEISMPKCPGKMRKVSIFYRQI